MCSLSVTPGRSGYPERLFRVSGPASCTALRGGTVRKSLGGVRPRSDRVQGEGPGRRKEREHVVPFFNLLTNGNDYENPAGCAALSAVLRAERAG